MAQGTKVSVCIIAKDEEACIGNCLESVKEADDIVVVDTGSTDRTREIARDYGARVYDVPWREDFAAAYNCADFHGKHRWKLSIDADERLCSTIDYVHEKCAEADNEQKPVLDCVLTYPEDNIWWYFPRVYKRYVDIMWVGAAHRTLNIRYRNPSDIEIHCGSSPNHQKDPFRTRRILLSELKENPHLVREKFYLGRDFANHHEYAQAAHWLREFLEDDYWPEYQAEAHLILCKIKRFMNKECDADRHCEKATDLVPEFKEAWELRYLLTGDEKHLERAENATNSGVLFVRNTSWLKKRL